MNNTNNECCPRLDLALWDNKEFNWENKKFIKAKVFTLFYMPVNIGRVIKRNTDLLTKAGGTSPDWLCLSDHTSKWNMNIYLAVDREIPDAENITLSGTFMSKVYEGDFKETADWCKDFENYVKNKSFEIRKWFMWYTTCPKCARKYGKNYVVIFGKVD